MKKTDDGSKFDEGSPEWRSGLRHCLAELEASLQTRVRSRAVSQPAASLRVKRAGVKKKRGLAGHVSEDA